MTLLSLLLLFTITIEIVQFMMGISTILPQGQGPNHEPRD